jgi:uridylate kinase
LICGGGGVTTAAVVVSMSPQDTMSKPPFSRVLLKISGEALTGPGDAGIDQATLDRVASEVAQARSLGVEIGLVVGGGNFVRGVQIAGQGGIERLTGDHMGMLATVMNGLALESAINRAGAPARLMSALAMPTVCESYTRQKAAHHFAKGRVVVFAGGTGSPFFTTDTTAVLKAAETGCQAVLKATNVDGVYDSDPKTNPNAQRFDRLTHAEALNRRLKVMDATAFALAQETRLPIVVFSITEPGAIVDVIAGRGRSTLVHL